MRCPYQTRVIHQDEYTTGYLTYPAEDRTEFGYCLRSECPFYDKVVWTDKVEEHCRKAESEIKN